MLTGLFNKNRDNEQSDGEGKSMLGLSGLWGQKKGDENAKKTQAATFPQNDKATAQKETVSTAVQKSKEAMDKAAEKMKNATKEAISTAKDSLQEAMPIVKKTSLETIENVKTAVGNTRDSAAKTTENGKVLMNQMKPMVEKVVSDAAKKTKEGIAKSQSLVTARGWWFPKKQATSFWTTSVKWISTIKPKEERLKLYLEKTFGTNNFDDLCTDRILQLSAELKEMTNEFVNEIPDKCVGITFTAP